MAGVVAATLAGLVTVRTGFTAIAFSIFFYDVACMNFTLAVIAGAFGFRICTHGANI
jgi:hypothetical protein